MQIHGIRTLIKPQKSATNDSLNFPLLVIFRNKIEIYMFDDFISEKNMDMLLTTEHKEI